MRVRFAASAVSAAFALALTLSGTAAGPAFASTPGPDIIPSNPTITRPLGPLLQPAPGSSSVAFQPDVRANYLGRAQGSGGTVTYRFRVQNIGIDTATNIGLETRIYQLSHDGSVGTLQSGNGGSIDSLSIDQSKEVTVVCTPLAGYRCDGATLQAHAANDLNPANDKAVSP